MKSNKPRIPSAAFVIAMIALFVAMAGGAYAGSKITSKKLANNAVTTKKIANKAVTGRKLKNKSVSTSVLKGNSVSTNKLQEGSVGESKLQPNSVGTGILQDGSVGTNKLQDDSIGEGELQPGSVGSSELQQNSVGGRELADITQATTLMSLNTGIAGQVIATCPQNTTLISGGYQSSVSPTVGFIAQVNHRAAGNGNGWVVGGANTGPTATSVTAIAYCLRDGGPEA